MKLDVSSPVGLYHCQISSRQDYLGSVAIDGEFDTIEIDLDRSKLLHKDTLRFHLMDIHGNKKDYTIKNITLPERVWRKNPDLNADEQEKERVKEPVKNNMPRFVKAGNKLTLSWAELKKR